MRTINYFLFLSILLLGSCIKPEPLNIEADIDDVRFDKPEAILNFVKENTRITVYANPGEANPSNMTMDFILSKGATIEPQPQTVKDYTSPVTYTVTSEDSKWKKTYTVSVVYEQIPLKFDFEYWHPSNTKVVYYTPFENVIMAGGQQTELNIWACANSAYSFISTESTSYPTQPTEDAQHGEKGVLLKTRTTGDENRPIAAGSLFIGEFDASQLDPLESTKFGVPFMRKPLKLKGWYKYNSGGIIKGTSMVDSCNIRAVLYRTSPEVKFLTGKNIDNHPSIVAEAAIADGSSTSDVYQPFDLDFKYKKEIDSKALAAGEYNLTIIFTSSRKGSHYLGALKSELKVDNIELVCDGE